MDTISGTLIALNGLSPLYKSGWSVLTSDGYWLVYQDTQNGTILQKVEGITGTPVTAIGQDPMTNGSGVLTSDGYWIVSKTGKATAVDGVVGVPISATGTQPSSGSRGSALMTDQGLWIVDSNAVGVRVGYEREEIVGQSLAESETQQVETAFDRDWVRRTFELPRLLPGEQMVVTLRGTVAQDNEALVVGNQAWVSSELTPRTGLETVENPAWQMKVTGQDMDPGVPDIPELPTPDEVPEQKNGITGTDTVSLNPLGTDVGQVDDLADQTPALIPANPDADLSGSVGGTVWYDNSLNAPDSDGLRAGSDTDTADTTREQRVEGMKVSVFSTSGMLLAETVTDQNGRWSVDRLPVNTAVDVQYESFGWKHDELVWTPVAQGAAPTQPADGQVTTLPIPGNDNSARDSDADATGEVLATTRLVTATSNNTPYGWADLGLQVLDAGITLVKGATDDYEPGATQTSSTVELDRVRGGQALEAEVPTLSADLPLGEVVDGRMDDGDTDPRTQAYGFTVDNPGQRDLTEVTLTDVTNAGNAAVLGTALEVTRADGSVEAAQLVGGRVQIGQNPVTLAKGDSVRGYFHVGFSDPDGEGADFHSNDLTVNARAVSPGGDLLGVVTDVDPFTSRYETVEPLALMFRKTSAVQAEDGAFDEGLQWATIRVESTNLFTLPDSDDPERVNGELGDFSSDQEGYFTVEDLPAGIYRVSEVLAPDGYVLPSGAWYVQLAYGQEGEPVIKAKAFGDVPYVAATSPDASSGTGEGNTGSEDEDALWGQLTITNAPVINPPLTGGGLLWLVLGGLAALGGASWLLLRPQPAKGAHSIE